MDEQPGPPLNHPKYWLTPGVFSQIPEFETKSILAPVTSCSNIVCLTPLRSTYDGLPLATTSKEFELKTLEAGKAVVNQGKTRPASGKKRIVSLLRVLFPGTGDRNPLDGNSFELITFQSWWRNGYTALRNQCYTSKLVGVNSTEREECPGNDQRIPFKPFYMK